MTKQSFLLFFLFVYCSLNAQNIVPNGNFETMSYCPNNFGQVAAATSWSHATNNWNPAYGTEYMNSCNTGQFSVPNNLFGSQAAHSGNGYVSQASMAPTISNGYRENICAKLTATMIVGATYSVSMFVSHADDTRRATNKMGVKFSTNSSFPVNNISHVYSSSLISNDALWTQITNTFVADSAYRYIGYGNFFTDASTTQQVVCSGCSYDLMMYYVDDIWVSLISLPPTLTVNTSSATCYGGSGTATVIVSPSAQYSYAWSGSTQTTSVATGLAAGTHTLTVTNQASQTAQTLTFQIAQPSAVAVSITGAATLCAGNTSPLTASASGGSPSYAYTWAGTNITSASYTPSATTLPGILTYTVAAVDINGCSTQAFFTRTVSTCLNISLSTSPALCFGSTGSATITASGDPGPFTYFWSGSSQTGSVVTGLSAGVHTVTVTGLASQSAHTSTFQIIQPSAIVLSIAGATAICAGESAMLTASASGGSPGYAYNWTGATVSSSSYTPPGNASPGLATYTVSVYDAKGCSTQAFFTRRISACTAVRPTANNDELVILYPNPGHAEFKLIHNLKNQDDADLEIYNALGQKIYEQPVSSPGTFNLSDQAKGIYIYLVKNNSSVIKRGKLILN